MHPFLPLPVSFDTAIQAGPGLMEWHVVVASDLSTLLMALPAGLNARFRMVEEEDEDDEDDDEEGHGEDSGLHGHEPGEGLPAPGGSDWAEEGPDLGGMGRGDVPYLRRVARP
jgi:hypothetical protein